jgi:hypothetical protein
MKTKLLLSLLFSFSFYLLSSQIPQGFNYQAIARDASGSPMVGQSLQVEISILSDTTTNGIVIWLEQFNTVRTNAYGLFTVAIGTGSRQSGTAVKFDSINWSGIPLYIKTQIFYGGSWKYMGQSKLWSVPYAMVSQDLNGPVKKLTVTGQTTSPDSILFEVKNKSGQTIFAIYNEGVRIYVDDGIAKGSTKGGFAIGGFGSAKAPSQEYLRVTKDSTRVYVNPLAKGTKGGFAIGGFSGAKAGVDNFLKLTLENYFIGHQSGAANTTGLYNTFLGYQSGITNTSGSSNCFIGKMSGKLNVNGNNNVFIGFESGFNNTGSGNAFQGSDNTFIGSNAGHQNTVGWSNVFMGTGAGFKTTDGYRNIFLGVGAGYENLSGSDNIYLGNDAGHYSTTGTGNIFLGVVAGYHNQTGSENIFFGTWSGGYNTTGSNNIGIGRQTGMQNNGSDNVYIGPYAGMYNTIGINNLFLGSFAGGGNTLGSGNVFLGYHAGYNEKGSNTLYIANSDIDSALVYGDFSLKKLGVGTSHPLARLELAVSGTDAYSGFGIRSSLTGGKLITLNQGTAGILKLTEPGVSDLITFNFNNSRVGIGTIAPGYTLHVNGSVAGTSAYANLSDERFKTDIVPITGALDKVLELQGITFNWDNSPDPDLNVDNRNHFGFSAQDIEKILPQVVNTAADKMKTKSVAYGDVVPVLVEAIKEQQQQIESARQENIQLKSELQSIRDEIEQIKSMLAKGGVK